MNILLTDGAGYIGRHAAVVLLDAGHEVEVIDSVSNSQPDAVTPCPVGRTRAAPASAAYYAQPAKAAAAFNRRASRSLNEMCVSTWHFQDNLNRHE